MAENANIIEYILNNSDGVLIIFFVLFAVAIIPFYKVFSKERKVRIEHENKRQEKFIEQNNLMIKALNEVTSAIAKLDTLIEITTKDSKASIERVHSRIDQMLDLLNRIYYNISGQNMTE
jgi:hypothetical protein